MWTVEESNPMTDLLISISVFTVHLFRAKPPSPPNAHLKKDLPDVFIIFRDLMKLNILIHPNANW